MLPNYCTTFAATRAFTCHGNSRQILNHRSIIQQREFRELYINKQKNVMHFDPSANTKCHASKISNNRIYRLHKFMYIMFSRGATHCNLMSTHVSGNCIFRTLIFFFLSNIIHAIFCFLLFIRQNIDAWKEKWKTVTEIMEKNKQK